MEVRTEVLCGYICELEAENVELRKLIEDMWELIQDMCNECPEHSKTIYKKCKFTERMCSLGMEKDDGIQA